MAIKKGHCLCGQVTFEYSGPEIRIGHCHCESCRRATSSGFTTFFAVPYRNFQFTGSTPKIFESSPGTRRLFCGNCGSPMAFEADRYPDKIHLYVASLENPNDIYPEYQGHVEEKLPWVQLDDNLPQFNQSGG